jgi:hypothetical protein
MPEIYQNQTSKQVRPIPSLMSLDICMVSPLHHPCFIKGMAVQVNCHYT